MSEIILKVLSIERIDRINWYTYLPFDFSIREKKVLYNNDGSFNSVKVSENIFVNISNKDLNKVATQKLKEYIGKYYIIAENGYKINIDKTLVKEYIYSKYTISLNSNIKLIKLILINYLDVIISNSYDKSWKSNKKDKHNKNAKYGFYKYKINLQVKMNDNIEYFSAIILIRNSLNKKKYLYDILNIKKID